MANIDDYLKSSEKAIVEFRQHVKDGDDSGSYEHAAWSYLPAISHALEAIYYQNQAIIELLKRGEKQ